MNYLLISLLSQASISSPPSKTVSLKPPNSSSYLLPISLFVWVCHLYRHKLFGFILILHLQLKKLSHPFNHQHPTTSTTIFFSDKQLYLCQPISSYLKNFSLFSLPTWWAFKKRKIFLKSSQIKKKFFVLP